MTYDVILLIYGLFAVVITRFNLVAAITVIPAFFLVLADYNARKYPALANRSQYAMIGYNIPILLILAVAVRMTFAAYVHTPKHFLLYWQPTTAYGIGALHSLPIYIFLVSYQFTKKWGYYHYPRDYRLPPTFASSYMALFTIITAESIVTGKIHNVNAAGAESIDIVGIVLLIVSAIVIFLALSQRPAPGLNKRKEKLADIIYSYEEYQRLLLLDTYFSDAVTSIINDGNILKPEDKNMTNEEALAYYSDLFDGIDSVDNEQLPQSSDKDPDVDRFYVMRPDIKQMDAFICDLMKYNRKHNNTSNNYSKLAEPFLEYEDDFDIYEFRSWQAATYRQLEAGKQGETEVAEFVDWLSKSIENVHVFSNANIRGTDGKSFEYDVIVVSPYGVTTLEVKNWSGSITVTESGQVYRNNDLLDENHDFILQNEKHIMALRAILKKHCDPNAVNGAVVMTNHKCEISNYSDYPIYTKSFVGKYIRSGKPVLSEQVIDDICNTLSENMVGAKKFPFPIIDEKPYFNDLRAYTAIHDAVKHDNYTAEYYAKHFDFSKLTSQEKEELIVDAKKNYRNRVESIDEKAKKHPRRKRS
jgi:hypothetical protein